VALELNQEHYDLLVSCSKKSDFTEWNDFVSKYEGIIRLRFGDFSGLELVGASFVSLNSKGADFYQANFESAKLEGIDFSNANMMEANFKRAVVYGSIFQDANFLRANLDNVTCKLVNFSCANFQEAQLRHANFFESNFYESNFSRADVEDAHFIGGGYNPFVGKELRLNLCGTIFNNAKFNSGTYFDLYNVSRETDFRTITFESANYSPGLRQTLQYCNRRHNWNNWYDKQNGILSFFVKRFWSYSDYGRSIKTIIKSFFSICILFALIYFIFPNLIHGLEAWQPIRSIYFSVVTMTTLGFGDMHASSNSWVAQCLVMIHVLYGYVLLGALITALSNLFSSDGPAQGLVEHTNESVKVRFHEKNST